MAEVPEIEDALPRAVVSELARIVLSTETLDSVLSRVADLCKKVVVGADEVSLTLVRAGRAATAAYTAELAMQADERQYGLDGGPCLDAGRGGELMHIVDMRTEDRWPDYSPQAVQVGVFSSLSIPLPIQEEVVGALNIYARKPDAFAEEALAAGRAFAAYGAIAVSNADTFVSTAELAKNLQIAMESRATIEQAKGMIMARSRCSADEAFDMLVKASQRENVKLRVLAERLVASAEGG
jgi:transcriptional regulator with GAF, ATPase, and Fis domain